MDYMTNNGMLIEMDQQPQDPEVLKKYNDLLKKEKEGSSDDE